MLTCGRWSKCLTVRCTLDALLAEAADKTVRAVAVRIAGARAEFGRRYDDAPSEVLQIVRRVAASSRPDREALDTEVIDWFAYARDGHRITADAATGQTAGERRWVVAEYWIDDCDEYVYDALTEPMTLAEATDYDQSDLAVLIAETESTEDYQECERLIDSLGPLVRQQIARA